MTNRNVTFMVNEIVYKCKLCKLNAVRYGTQQKFF